MDLGLGLRGGKVLGGGGCFRSGVLLLLLLGRRGGVVCGMIDVVGIVEDGGEVYWSLAGGFHMESRV